MAEEDLGLEAAEHKAIEKALRVAGWNKRKAATLLKIGKTTLYRKIRQYNLRQPQPPSPECGAGPEQQKTKKGRGTDVCR